jgi:hypothetical protein
MKKWKIKWKMYKLWSEKIIFYFHESSKSEERKFPFVQQKWQERIKFSWYKKEEFSFKVIRRKEEKERSNNKVKNRKKSVECERKRWNKFRKCMDYHHRTFIMLWFLVSGLQFLFFYNFIPNRIIDWHKQLYGIINFPNNVEFIVIDSFIVNYNELRNNNEIFDHNKTMIIH